MEDIATVDLYDRYCEEFDSWFEKHPGLYQSELLALQQAIPENKKGIEIGVGTGRFAWPFNIKFGVEPSQGMARLARQRGVQVIQATAENLPIESQSYDFATMVTTVCFLNDIPKAFAEVHRILKPAGVFIIGLIDRRSELGKTYQQKKNTNKFYRYAHFHSVEEITHLLEQAGFNGCKYWQTLFSAKEQIAAPQPGYGKGSFVVISAQKP